MNKIIINDEQLKIISKALDLYSRLGIGQFEELVNFLRFDKRVSTESLPKLEEIMDDAKNVAFSLPKNASHGIGHPEVPQDFKIARDMNVSIEHHLWKQGQSKSIVSVHSTPPFAFGKEALIEIEKVGYEGNTDGY